MRFPTPLVPARLARRYKRFLADCVLEADGRAVTAHCPNPGSMQGLAEPGTRVWLEPNDDPARKLKFGWRLVEHEGGHLTGIDTALPNRMLRAALQARAVPALAAYGGVRAEVAYGQGSRVDFLLEEPGLPPAWVEVKSVTLSRRADLAEFPDAKTARGARHMADLAAMAAQGHRAAVLFLVQRSDAAAVAIAADIDPAYAAALTAAARAGVEVIAHRAEMSLEGVTLGPELPVTLPAG
jgi:sugar fermentation stimulation protein A